MLDHEQTPWVDDGLRVLSGRRAEHTQRLLDELDAAGRQYVFVGGDFAQRERETKRLVDDLLVRASTSTAAAR